MQEERFDGQLGRTILIDICHACHSFWFDTRESVALTPGSTLALFRVIGEKLTRPNYTNAELAKCPRCKARLRRTQDMQRNTRFEYLNCPNGHGRLTSFFDFLREKDFIRPLTERQIADLRHNVGSVNCANCGAAVELSKGASCSHCRTPLSMLDMKQAEKLVSQLQKAEDRANQPMDPSLPLELLRVKRETERAFEGVPDRELWFKDVVSTNLLGASLTTIARWLKKSS
jgi:hypothetical protein